MFTMTQAPHEVKLYSEQGELLVQAEATYDASNMVYLRNMVNGGFFGTQIRWEREKLIMKLLTRMLIKNAYNTKILTPDSLIQNDKGVVKKARWYYLGTFFPNPTSGT